MRAYVEIVLPRGRDAHCRNESVCIDVSSVASLVQAFTSGRNSWHAGRKDLRALGQSLLVVMLCLVTCHLSVRPLCRRPSRDI